MRSGLSLIFIFVIYQASAQTSTGAPPLFSDMLHAINRTHTCSFVISMKERIHGAMRESEYIVKMQNKPLKVYAYSVKPDAGAEALYLQGAESGKVLINPNKFPYINLSFAPNNMMMRKNHHYTILQSGFIYTYAILKQYETRNGEDFYKLWKQRPDSVVQGKKYHVLEMNNPGFGYTTYTVSHGETVNSIAEKILVNDHMIMDLNKSIGDYEDIKAGQSIRVPNSFAKRLLFFIDPLTNLPLIQEVYDDKGLYNRVVFTSVVQNPVLGEQEFSSDNPKYGF